MLAAFLVRHAVGVPSIVWMNHYAPEDFKSLDAVIQLLTATRLPLPPLLTLAEMANYLHDGTTRWTTVWIYRLSLIAAYVLALVLARKSPVRFAAAFVLAPIFLAATLAIHPAGAWVYDILQPALLLGFFAALAAIVPRRPANVLLALIAGLCLGLAELTRPHMVYLLPLLLAGALARIWPKRTSVIVAFLLPVAVLSGGWHVHQYANLGQFSWSNHGGFNLINAWPMVTPPALVPETQERVAPGRYTQIDTPEHGVNSRRLTRAVLAFAFENPWRATVHVAERLSILLSAPTSYMRSEPRSWILPLYQVAARYAGLYMLLAGGAVALALVLQPRRATDLLGKPDNLLLLTGAFSIVLVAVADHGEEARFLLMLLPLMAAAPFPRLGWGLVPRGWAIAAGAAVAALVLVVQVVATGAIRHEADVRTGDFTLDRNQPRPPHGGPLRVLALNIRGRHWDDGKQAAARLNACLAQADIAGLTEVAGKGWFAAFYGGSDQAAPFARAQGMDHAYAARERRWWRDQLGQAILTRLPGGRFEAAPLPRRLSDGYNSWMVAPVQWNRQTVQVMTTQVGGADAELQLSALLAVFDALPAPAILMGGLAKLGDYPPLARLAARPDTVAIVNGDYRPGRVPAAEWIVAKGFRQAAARRCPGPRDEHPGLILELVAR